MSIDRSVLANLHPCHKCVHRAKYVVVLPYVTTPFLVCGTHRRAYAENACYQLRSTGERPKEDQS